MFSLKSAKFMPISSIEVFQTSITTAELLTDLLPPLFSPKTPQPQQLGENEGDAIQSQWIFKLIRAKNTGLLWISLMRHATWLSAFQRYRVDTRLGQTQGWAALVWRSHTHTQWLRQTRAASVFSSFSFSSSTCMLESSLIDSSMLNPRIVRQTWNLRNEQRDPGLRVIYIIYVTRKLEINLPLTLYLLRLS